MTTSSSVLIVSTVADVATDHVVKILSARSIPHKRINTEDYPFSRTFGFRISPLDGISSIFGNLALERPTSVWYRRVRSPAKPTEMQDGIYDFCLQETRASLLGSLMSHSCHWMSFPASVWQAEFKPYQLAVAHRLGLEVPNTVITNEPYEIRKAFETFGAMVVKPSRSGHLIYDGTSHAVFTSRLLAEHLEHLEDAKLSPAIYQQLIPKKFDIRATVVGDQIFAAAIDSQSDPDAMVDWRHTSNPDLPHFRITLPQEIQQLLLALMNSLNLTFGAIDLVQTPDGNYVFLEVNPNGQWLWLDDQLDLGISDAVATWLARPHRTTRNELQ